MSVRPDHNLVRVWCVQSRSVRCKKIIGDVEGEIRISSCVHAIVPDSLKLCVSRNSVTYAQSTYGHRFDV